MGNADEVGDTSSVARVEVRRGVWAGDRVRVTKMYIITKAVGVNEIALKEGGIGMRMSERMNEMQKPALKRFG